MSFIKKQLNPKNSFINKYCKLLIIIFGKSSFNLHIDVFDSITNIPLKKIFLNP